MHELLVHMVPLKHEIGDIGKENRGHDLFTIDILVGLDNHVK